MRALVTGGTGFVGSNITRELLALGHEVVITGVHGEQTVPDFAGLCIEGDLASIDWSEAGKLDAIFHEAAINDTTSLDAPAMMRANVEATLSLFGYAATVGCKKIVYASSTAVYGDGPAPYREGQKLHPLNPYAESKMVMEERAAEFVRAHPDVAVMGLRYCNVYGPGESHKGKRASMIHQLAQQMKKGNPRVFKYGEQKRDYIYVKDVVRANLRALEAGESGVVNCGSGAATTFNDLIQILNTVLGTERTPEYIDNPFTGRYQDHTECDMSRAKEQIGFTPEYDIKKGIEDYAQNGLLD